MRDLRAVIVLQSLTVLALAWIALKPDAAPARPDAGPTPTASIELAAILDRLDAIAVALTDPRAASAERQDARAERRAVVPAPAETLPALRAEIAGLRDALVSTAWRGGIPQAVAAIASQVHDADWTKLAAFRTEFKRDKPGAFRRILFTPAQEILTRFGRPSYVNPAQGGGQTWFYKRASESGMIYFRISDGLVIGGGG